MKTPIAKNLDHNTRVFNFDNYLVCIGLGSDVDEAFTELKDYCSDLLLENPTFETIVNADPGELIPGNESICSLVSSLREASKHLVLDGKVRFYPFIENKYFSKRKVLLPFTGTELLFHSKGEVFPHEQILQYSNTTISPGEELLSILVKSFRVKFKVRLQRDKGKKIRTFMVISPNGVEGEFNTIAQAKIFAKEKIKSKLFDTDIYELQILENRKTESGGAPLVYQRYLHTQKAKLNLTYGVIKEKHIGKTSGFVFLIQK